MSAVSKLTQDSINQPGPENTLMGKVNELVPLVNNMTGNGTPAAGAFAAVTCTNLTATGNVSLGDAGADTVGFYGHAGIAQQTGVAVTAAAIHAALVALGLITA